MSGPEKDNARSAGAVPRDSEGNAVSIDGLRAEIEELRSKLSAVAVGGLFEGGIKWTPLVNEIVFSLPPDGRYLLKNDDYDLFYDSGEEIRQNEVDGFGVEILTHDDGTPYIDFLPLPPAGGEIGGGE